MQTDRTRRLVWMALGSAAVFDVTGAGIYRVVRAVLPAPPATAVDPFQEATRELLHARRDAMRAAGEEDVTRLA